MNRAGAVYHVLILSPSNRAQIDSGDGNEVPKIALFTGFRPLGLELE